MRRFVADASHELRTPLTSIRGFAELYRHGASADPEETHRMMGRIEAEATRMGALVEDLLQLARLDQHRPVAALPVDLGELAADAVHDARAVQPDRPVELELTDSLTDVPVVLGDEGRLRQVIGNLVTNALTHTPPGTPVTVRLSEEPGDPDAVTVTVADRGPGMSAEDAERVFERFYRADASRTRAAGGTGLGLSIVSSLVAAHHGTVVLTTAPGEGAAFAVRLPRSGPAGQD
jgi:two-component system OmpR family sensor kinase